MKCMICGAVDEAVEIETGYIDRAKREAAEAVLRAQSERMSGWNHLQVTVTHAGARLEVLAGDLCPAEQIAPGTIVVTKKETP